MGILLKEELLHCVHCFFTAESSETMVLDSCPWLFVKCWMTCVSAVNVIVERRTFPVQTSGRSPKWLPFVESRLSQCRPRTGGYSTPDLGLLDGTLPMWWRTWLHMWKDELSQCCQYLFYTNHVDCTCGKTNFLSVGWSEETPKIVM